MARDCKRMNLLHNNRGIVEFGGIVLRWRREIGMRKILTAALLLLVTAGTSHAQQTTIVVSAYAASVDQYRRDLFDPFEKMCGCKVVLDLGNSAERLTKLDARKDNPNIDVAVLTTFNALEAARKGLIDKVDVERLSNYADIFDFAKDPLGDHWAVGYTFYSNSIAYRTDKLPAVSSWTDLWSPAMSGHVALPNISSSQAPLVLSMAEEAFGGQSPKFETGIAKIGELKTGIVTFYERSAQLIQLFQSEEIWAAPIGRFDWAAVRSLKLPIAWASPKEGQPAGMNVIVLVKGSKNRELALRLMDYWLSVEVQTKLGQDLVDSPANSKVKLSDQAAQNLTYGSEATSHLHFIAPADILTNRAAWLEGWNAHIAR
jgi:putative spermidine/putrescine transport system substrate-binding protein